MENVKKGKTTPHSYGHLLKYRAMHSQQGLGRKGPVLLPPPPRSLQHLPIDGPCASAGTAACAPPASHCPSRAQGREPRRARQCRRAPRHAHCSRPLLPSTASLACHQLPSPWLSLIHWRGNLWWRKAQGTLKANHACALLHPSHLPSLSLLSAPQIKAGYL